MSEILLHELQTIKPIYALTHYFRGKPLKNEDINLINTLVEKIKNTCQETYEKVHYNISQDTQYYIYITTVYESREEGRKPFIHENYFKIEIFYNYLNEIKDKLTYFYYAHFLEYNLMDSIKDLEPRLYLFIDELLFISLNKENITNLNKYLSHVIKTVWEYKIKKSIGWFDITEETNDLIKQFNKLKTKYEKILDYTKFSAENKKITINNQTCIHKKEIINAENDLKIIKQLIEKLTKTWEIYGRRRYYRFRLLKHFTDCLYNCLEEFNLFEFFPKSNKNLYEDTYSKIQKYSGLTGKPLGIKWCTPVKMSYTDYISV